MISFKVETITEDDCSWENLLVKTPDKDWHSADINYGVETEAEVRHILRNVNYYESSRIAFNLYLKSINENFGQFERVEDSLGSYDTVYALTLDGIIIIASEYLSEFEVGYETYDSGSYWEPPSSDYVEHSKCKGLLPAMRDALGLYIMNQYAQKQEAEMPQDYHYNPEEY